MIAQLILCVSFAHLKFDMYFHIFVCLRFVCEIFSCCSYSATHEFLSQCNACEEDLIKNRFPMFQSFSSNWYLYYRLSKFSISNCNKISGEIIREWISKKKGRWGKVKRQNQMWQSQPQHVLLQMKFPVIKLCLITKKSWAVRATSPCHGLIISEYLVNINIIVNHSKMHGYSAPSSVTWV